LVLPKPGCPAVLGLSPAIMLIFAGLFVLWLFSAWVHHVEKRAPSRSSGYRCWGTGSSLAARRHGH
jgi:hypothetical protein